MTTGRGRDDNDDNGTMVEAATIGRLNDDVDGRANDDNDRFI